MSATRRRGKESGRGRGRTPSSVETSPLRELLARPSVTLPPSASASTLATSAARDVRRISCVALAAGVAVESGREGEIGRQSAVRDAREIRGGLRWRAVVSRDTRPARPQQGSQAERKANGQRERGDPMSSGETVATALGGETSQPRRERPPRQREPDPSRSHPPGPKRAHIVSATPAYGRRLEAARWHGTHILHPAMASRSRGRWERGGSGYGRTGPKHGRGLTRRRRRQLPALAVHRHVLVGGLDSVVELGRALARGDRRAGRGHEREPLAGGGGGRWRDPRRPAGGDGRRGVGGQARGRERGDDAPVGLVDEELRHGEGGGTARGW